MVYDDSRLSKHGGLITYIHDSFCFERLSDVVYNQNSTVYESMFLKIPNKTSEFTKYIIGNIYRRPSSILAELDQFIEEFTLVAHNLQEKPSKSYFINSLFVHIRRLQ